MLPLSKLYRILRRPFNVLWNATVMSSFLGSNSPLR